jgi:hypothetical protein
MSQRRSMGEGAGIAGGIAALVLVGFVLLPALVAVLLFLFFTVMGMIKGTDFRAATLNVPILFTGIAVIVATIVVLLLVAAGLLGRGLTPKRRRKHAA